MLGRSEPAAQIAGRSRVVSLEEPLGAEIEDQETLCLHDVLRTLSVFRRRSQPPGSSRPREMTDQPVALQSTFQCEATVSIP